MVCSWLMDNEAWEAWMTNKPVLQRLYEERVFSLGFLENGNLGVTENCDGYFGDELTLADLSQLIAELTSVQSEMVLIAEFTSVQAEMVARSEATEDDR